MSPRWPILIYYAPGFLAPISESYSRSSLRGGATNCLQMYITKGGTPVPPHDCLWGTLGRGATSIKPSL